MVIKCVFALIMLLFVGNTVHNCRHSCLNFAPEQKNKILFTWNTIDRHVNVLCCLCFWLISFSLFRWSRPSQVNGALEFYSIFLSRGSAEPVLAHNSSDLFEGYTLRNLTPGTAYTITVAVSLSVFTYFTHLYLCVTVCLSF